MCSDEPESVADAIRDMLGNVHPRLTAVYADVCMGVDFLMLEVDDDIELLLRGPGEGFQIERLLGR